MSRFDLETGLDAHHAQESELADVAVAYGDGIGPEIMEATLAVLEAAGAKLRLHPIAIGEQVYRSGISAGISHQDLQTLRSCGVFLKAPITTPQGGGYKSLNVTIRKQFGLYANLRPCRALVPYVRTLHPTTDLVIIRENEEDVYGGIEHQQTQDVTQCLKLITRSGSERIVRFAFEYARANGRKKVTCMSKDNIMKLTDGLFHRVFSEIAAEYPELQSEHLIIDIGAARLATRPEQFDVVVLPNLYGDILSDVAAELCGSVGMSGSANIGDALSMFEAIHGSAPDIAGTQMANPSGLLSAAVLMLAHLGQTEIASRIQNAWLSTIEAGLHTRDIFSEHSQRCLSTMAFAQAVIERLGQTPTTLTAPKITAPLHLTPGSFSAAAAPAPTEKTRVGVDIFLDWEAGEPGKLGTQLSELSVSPLALTMITNRGTKVWPGALPETRCVDHWRCRFEGQNVTGLDVAQAITALTSAGYDVIKTEGLFAFDGKPGYSLGQGQ